MLQQGASSIDSRLVVQNACIQVVALTKRAIVSLVKSNRCDDEGSRLLFRQVMYRE